MRPSMTPTCQHRRTVWITAIFALMLTAVIVYLYSQCAPRAAEGEDAVTPDPLGLLLIDVDAAAQSADFPVTESGVYVLAVAENSPAQRAGLRSGDRIVSLNGVRVLATGELYELLARVVEGDPVLLAGLRDGAEQTWALAPGVDAPD